MHHITALHRTAVFPASPPGAPPTLPPRAPLVPNRAQVIRGGQTAVSTVLVEQSTGERLVVPFYPTYPTDVTATAAGVVQ